MRRFSVPMVRKAQSFKRVVVEAFTKEEAVELAIEKAPSEDWTGNTESSEYDVDGEPDDIGDAIS